MSRGHGVERARHRQHRERRDDGAEAGGGRHLDLGVPADQHRGHREHARHRDGEHVAAHTSGPVGIRHHDHHAAERQSHGQPRERADALPEQQPPEEPGHPWSDAHQDQRVRDRRARQRQDEARRGGGHAHGHREAGPADRAPLRDHALPADDTDHEQEERGGEQASPHRRGPRVGRHEAGDQAAGAPQRGRAGHEEHAAGAGHRAPFYPALTRRPGWGSLAPCPSRFRSTACASSSSATSSPARPRGSCSPTSAPTSSRSSGRAKAISRAGCRPATPPTSTSSTATSAASRSTSRARPRAATCSCASRRRPTSSSTTSPTARWKRSASATTSCPRRIPRLIYLALKGFLPGPYEARPFLDELAQMSAGLAFMTGPRGQPMRAGASIVDVGAAAYGVIAVLAALQQRARDRPRPEDHVGPLRDDGVLGRAVARELRRDRRAVGADAGDAPGHAHGLGHLPALHGGRRASRSSSASRPTRTGSGSARSSGSTTCSPTRRSPTTPSAWRRAGGCRSGSARRCVATRAPSWRSGWSARACRSRRCAARISSWTIRTSTRPTSSWRRRCPAAGSAKLPKMPVRSTAFEFGLRRPAPRLGEHTREVLQEFGLSTDEIDALASRRVIG